MARDPFDSLGEEVAQLKKAWRRVLTAYNRYWASMLGNEEATRTDSAQWSQARADLAQWKREHPHWREEMDLDSIDIGPSVLARTTRVLVPPHEDAGVQEAIKQWVGALHGGVTDPFRPEAAAFDIDAVRIRIGTIRMRDEDFPQQPVYKVTPLYEEVPIAVLSRTQLTPLALTGFSDDELQTLYENATGEKASEAELAALRSEVVATRKTDPDQARGSLSKRDYNRLRLPPLNFARLAPTPFNLIRYYHSSGVTEAERERIIVAVAGWIAATARGRFVTGDAERPFHQEIVSYVADFLQRFEPLPLVEREAHSRHEMAFLLTLIQPYASALVATACKRLFAETINCLSRTEEFRRASHKLKSGSQNGVTGEVENQPASMPMTMPDPPPNLSDISTRKAQIKATETVAQINRRLLGLTESERRAFELWREGRKYREIAAEMNISTSNVGVLLSRAKKRINSEQPTPSRASQQEAKRFRAQHSRVRKD